MHIPWLGGSVGARICPQRCHISIAWPRSAWDANRIGRGPTPLPPSRPYVPPLATPDSTNREKRSSSPDRLRRHDRPGVTNVFPHTKDSVHVAKSGRVSRKPYIEVSEACPSNKLLRTDRHVCPNFGLPTVLTLFNHDPHLLFFLEAANHYRVSSER